LLDPL